MGFDLCESPKPFSRFPPECGVEAFLIVTAALAGAGWGVDGAELEETTRKVVLDCAGAGGDAMGIAGSGINCISDDVASDVVEEVEGGCQKVVA